MGLFKKRAPAATGAALPPPPPPFDSGKVPLPSLDAASPTLPPPPAYKPEDHAASDSLSMDSQEGTQDASATVQGTFPEVDQNRSLQHFGKRSEQSQNDPFSIEPIHFSPRPSASPSKKQVSLDGKGASEIASGSRADLPTHPLHAGPLPSLEVSGDSARMLHADEEPVERAEDHLMHRPRVLDEDSVQPLFVSANDYQTILEGIEEMKHGLGETEGHVARILDVRQRQERLLDDWRSHLEDVQKRLTYIDEVIFRTQ